jgi:cell division protein FtsB
MHDWAARGVRGNAVFSRGRCLRVVEILRSEFEEKAKQPVRHPWMLGHSIKEKLYRGSDEWSKIPTQGRCKKTHMNWQEQIRNVWRGYGAYILLIFVVVLIVHDIFGPHGYLVMRRTQQEIQKVNGVLQRVNKENSLLEQDVQDLKTDPQTIRKIAREELGLAQPGEIIIKLPAPEPQAQPAAKP